MSVPSNMLYMLAQIANHSCNTIRIEPQSQSSLSSTGNSIVEFVLPTNATLNMHSLTLNALVNMHGKTGGTQAGTPNEAYNEFALVPAGGLSALLARVSWSAGGQSLDNGCSSYAEIFRIKQNVQVSSQNVISDQRVNQQGVIQPLSDFSATDVGTNPVGRSGREFTNKGQERRLSVSRLYGFTELHPTYLQTSILPQLRVTFTISTNPGMIPLQYGVVESGVEPSAQVGVTPLGTARPTGQANTSASGTISAQISQMYMTVQVVSVGSGLLEAMVQRQLQEAGSIRIPYRGYNSYVAQHNGAGGTVRGSISTQSLNRVYSTMRYSAPQHGDDPAHAVAPQDAAYTVAQRPVRNTGSPCIGYIQAGVNFTGSGVGTSQLRILSSPYPLFQATTFDNFNALLHAEARSYSDARGGLIGSYEQFVYNCWCQITQLSHAPDNVALISGLNLSSVNGSVDHNTVKSGDTEINVPNMDTVQHSHEMYLESTTTLMVGPQRSIAVTY